MTSSLNEAQLEITHVGEKKAGIFYRLAVIVSRVVGKRLAVASV